MIASIFNLRAPHTPWGPKGRARTFTTETIELGLQHGTRIARVDIGGFIYEKEELLERKLVCKRYGLTKLRVKPGAGLALELRDELGVVVPANGRLVLSPPEVWFSGLYEYVGRLVPGVQCC